MEELKIDFRNNVVLKKDIIEWDIINWTRALKFIDDKLDKKDITNKKVLCIGERRGGMSLYFSLLGAKEGVCSDITEDFSNAKVLHKKYALNNIVYKVLNAVDDLPCEEYDLICFKSVLGAIGYGDNIYNQYKAINNIFNALKKGGIFCFMENLQSSAMHMFLRRYCPPSGSYKKTWRYLSTEEIKDMLSDFSLVEMKTVGFLGNLGLNEDMRGLFSKWDCIFDKYLPETSRYIASVYAVK